MRTKHRWLIGWLIAALLVVTAFAPPRAVAFVVHEWGTFTTHHGLDGGPYIWIPLTLVSDLPTFVYKTKSRVTKKNTYPGTVRMETPVLYFYGESRQKVSASVGFPSGIISEWYPSAKWSRQGSAGHA